MSKFKVLFIFGLVMILSACNTASNKQTQAPVSGGAAPAAATTAPAITNAVGPTQSQGGVSAANTATPITLVTPTGSALLATQAVTSTTSSLPATSGQGPGNAAVGASIFEKNCTTCHGNQGQGVDAPALRNNQYVQSANEQEIFQTVANGVPKTEMPAWLYDNGGPLSEAQINDTVAYLKTLQGVSEVAAQNPPTEEVAETPPPANESNPQPARPSNSGGTGNAVTLTGDASSGQKLFGPVCATCHGPQGVQGVPNPDSDDGAVPELNPIDPTIVSKDPQTFAENIDLFIEHGSVPEGENPRIIMPAFGDHKVLTDQQISDIIAYVIKLNSATE